MGIIQWQSIVLVHQGAILGLEGVIDEGYYNLVAVWILDRLRNIGVYFYTQQRLVDVHVRNIQLLRGRLKQSAGD